MDRKRVAITGFGIICSLGEDEDTIYTSLLEDRVSFVISEKLEDVVISPVMSFEFKKYIPTYKYVRYLPRSWQFALCAAKKAIISSGLSKIELQDGGLFVGIGPNVDALDNNILDKPLGLISILPNTPTFCISHLFGIHGENLTISNACASSLQSIGEGFLRISSGRLKLALCGGADSRLSSVGLKLYGGARILHRISNGVSPNRSYAPFDKENVGFVPGEGGAFLVLEEMDHAIKRGANILGEVMGYSSSMDGLNPTAPDVRARCATKCIKRAIDMSGISSDHIDVVFAHGTGTPLNDTMEIALVKEIFRSNTFYISSLKSWIGHLGAGCGAAEMVISIICLKNRFIPRIRNLDHPRDDELKFLLSDKRGSFNYVLFQSFGFGGQNAGVVLRLS